MLELYYPVKNPINPNNLFGADPEYYKNLSGELGHPGNDFPCPIGTPIYAPCDGDAFYTTDKYGGCGIYIRVPDNGNPAVNVILWHMCSKDDVDFPILIPSDGRTSPVKLGQLLGYSGNSGAPIESTGPHLHVGVQPCDATGGALNPNNGFHGCEDPAKYWNGKFAEDVDTVSQIVDLTASAVAVAQQLPEEQEKTLLESLKVVLQNIVNWFTK